MRDGLTVQMDLWQGTLLVEVPPQGNGLVIRVFRDGEDAKPYMSWEQWDQLVAAIAAERKAGGDA